MPDTPAHPLTQAQAVPGARIVHLRSGWKATIVRPDWPALWVDFDSDVHRGRKDARHVWAGIFGVLAEETPRG
jgi:hypothetical protein